MPVYFNRQKGTLEDTPTKALVAGALQLITLLAMAWFSGDVDGVVLEEALSAFVLSLVGAGFVWLAPYFREADSARAAVVRDDDDPGAGPIAA